MKDKFPTHEIIKDIGSGLNLNKKDGLKLHNYIYDKYYNHLDLDTVVNKTYKNFNELILKE